jgi:hypothetical protein
MQTLADRRRAARIAKEAYRSRLERIERAAPVILAGLYASMPPEDIAMGPAQDYRLTLAVDQATELVDLIDSLSRQEDR